MPSVFGTVVAIFEEPELSPPRTLATAEPERLSTGVTAVVMAHFGFVSCDLHHPEVLVGDLIFVTENVLVSVVGLVEPVVLACRVCGGVVVLVDSVLFICINHHHFPVCQRENLVTFLDNLEISEGVVDPFDWRWRLLGSILRVEDSQSLIIVKGNQFASWVDVGSSGWIPDVDVPSPELVACKQIMGPDARVCVENCDSRTPMDRNDVNNVVWDIVQDPVLEGVVGVEPAEGVSLVGVRRLGLGQLHDKAVSVPSEWVDLFELVPVIVAESLSNRMDSADDRISVQNSSVWTV